MLRFIEGLRLSKNAKPDELSTVAIQIYKEFFAEHATSATGSGKHNKLSTISCDAFDAHITNQIEPPAPSDNDVWIFGYGSLVWKADFPYIDRRRGYVCGYKRRFYQHSIDHRGVPEKPGRVVTLLPGDTAVDCVYGVAYRIAAIQKGQVLDHLDYREKNGYERCNLHFYEYHQEESHANDPINVIMYVATQNNESYAGNVWQVPQIAEQIFTSAGPSGPNREYLFNLAIAMRDLFPGAVDEHLNELVDCVQCYIENEEPLLLERAMSREIANLISECVDKQPEFVVQQLKSWYARYEQQPGWREALLSRELQFNQKRS